MALEQLSCKKKKNNPFEGLFRNLAKLLSKMGGNRKSLLEKDNKKYPFFEASCARKMRRNKPKVVSRSGQYIQVKKSDRFCSLFYKQPRSLHHEPSILFDRNFSENPNDTSASKQKIHMRKHMSQHIKATRSESVSK